MTPEQVYKMHLGMENALKSVPLEIVDEVLRFWYAYAKLNYRFTSAQVLVAFLKRKGSTPDNGKGWRDCWGSLTTKARKLGIMTKVGLMINTENHTHMGHGAYWQSLVFVGDTDEFESPEADLKHALYLKWIARDYTNIRDYTEAVFSMGVKFALENKEYAVEKYLDSL